MIPRKGKQLAVVAIFTELWSTGIQSGFLRSGRNYTCEVKNTNNLLLIASRQSSHKQEQLFPEVFRLYF